MAGPFGFFKGLGARVLYSMPATAICWSTYEFFKYMLSQKNHDEYRSTVSKRSSDSSKPSDRKRTEDAPLKPKRFVIATEIIAEGTSKHHSSEGASSSTSLLPVASELKAIPGAGVYSTLTLKSEPIYDPMGRGCNR